MTLNLNLNPILPLILKLIAIPIPILIVPKDTTCELKHTPIGGHWLDY